ncbi:MAG TPA: radical SAM protein, partial [Bacteroidota bacterium]
RTIVGGVHCEVCPADLDDPAVDFRVVRNAVRTLPALLEHIRRAGGIPAGVLTPGQPLVEAELPSFDFTYPRPARSLTDRYRDRYFYIFHDRVALLKTAFGCPYKCTFCFCRAITRGRYAERPLEEVMAELETIREREIYIVDDDFLVDAGRVRAFIAENRTRGLDKRYLLYGRADFIVRHPELIREFRSVGLSTVIVGFESFFEDELERYQKGTTAEVNRRAMEVLRENGVDCYATVIIPPEWDREKFLECGTIMKSLGIHYVNLQPLTPLPGTGSTVTDRELVFGRDAYARWDLAHVTLRPGRMTVTEFYRALLELYNTILFQPTVLRDYVRRYRLSQIWKMTIGTMRVRHQYMRKIREASRGIPGDLQHA